LHPSKNKPKNPPAYFLYGTHAVKAVLRYQPYRAKKLLIARTKEAGELISLGERNQVAVEQLERGVLEHRFGLGADAQGVILQASPFPFVTMNDFLAQSPKLVLVLDNWQDSVNIGRAARAALAFGADGIIVGKDRCAGVTNHAEKAAVGALAQVPVVQVTNISDAITRLKDEHFFAYGADADGTTSLVNCDFAAKVAVVIGQEGEGLRDLTKKRCDMVLSIPMANPDICLNAADTALVFLFHLANQNRQ
jgi:23S rRNA (guanosine2251-2'-O)-methyltransferase